jgi:hypothetical protein
MGCRTNGPSDYWEDPMNGIKKHKHTDSEQFISDDILLYKHIQEINDIIKEINTTLNTSSPCFSTDLHHPDLNTLM